MPALAASGPLLPVLAVLTLCWSATCLVDALPSPLAGLLVAAAAASPAVAVLAVGVGGLAVLGRRWVTAGLGGVACLLPWTFALPYAVPGQPPVKGTTAVRVLVVNARAGHAEPRDIVAAVQGHRVDLLVVTELTSRLAHDLTTSGVNATLTAQYVSVNGDPEAGIGIWSSRSLDRITPVTGTSWPAVRGVLDAGPGLTVVAGHAVPPFPNRGGRWASDLRALRSAADVDGPVVVVGNLNGSPWNPQFRSMASGRLHDAGDLLGRGIRPTWPTWLPLPLLPLDHALVGGGVAARSLDTVTIDGTEHRGLLVSLLV